MYIYYILIKLPHGHINARRENQGLGTGDQGIGKTNALNRKTFALYVIKMSI